MKNNTLTIIPARSGSKGLQDKNIKQLKGKPLLAYTIDAAKQSGVCGRIIISTDSQAYIQIAEQYGADAPFVRPAELCTDSASSLDVIEHAIHELSRLGEEYEHVILLQPTSPLRRAVDIVNAVQLLKDKRADTIVSVCESEHSPSLMNTLDDSLNLEGFLTKAGITRRQDKNTFYRVNGAIYILRVDHFLQTRDFYGSNSYAYIMEKIHSVDIDEEVDFYLAGCLIEYMKTMSQ